MIDDRNGEMLPALTDSEGPTVSETQDVQGVGADREPQPSLTVTDNRTGRTYELPLEDGAIQASELKKIKLDDDDPGLASFDPGFVNTASCRSAITFLDGDKGQLSYRGYPIEQLAEQSTYLEVTYLLIHGELPTPQQYEQWVYDITNHTFVHENIKQFMMGFRYTAHPMGMLLASIGALSTFYPESSKLDDDDVVQRQIVRLVAKVATLAAFSYRHSQGLPYVYPDNQLSFVGNFMSMMWKMSEHDYEVDPRVERAIDVLWILHADHEQNCSTNAVRAVGSSRVDPYSAVAAGIAALYGPLHGGANEAVLSMLQRVQSVENIPSFIEGVKRGDERLMGFGHRVYKNYDPRATIIKRHTMEVIDASGGNPLLDVALELERIALEDEYFVSRTLYPNVDFYSGLIYQALGIPTTMFTVMFAIPRVSGWVSQWLELINDKEQKIARPKQLYVGPPTRDYVLAAER
jgi:citrate synthase